MGKVLYYESGEVLEKAAQSLVAFKPRLDGVLGSLV